MNEEILEEKLMQKMKQATYYKKKYQEANNIINELEKWLEEKLERLDIIGYDDEFFDGIELALDKLQELKGVDKE